MKKHYYFIIPIFIMIYLIYLIINETYKNYIENDNIEKAQLVNQQTREKNSEIKNKIDYIATNAFKTKELKELGYLLKGEKTIYLTDKENIAKYVKKELEIETFKDIKNEKIYDNMNNFEKWIYLIYGTDIR